MMRCLCFGVVTYLCFSFALSARADFVCPIDFNYGLVVNETQIRVMQKSRTLQQINHQKDLFVEGRLQTLTEQQQQWLSAYAKGLHELVPNMIVLATEGADIAIDAIDRVYQGFVGKDNDSYERMRETMQKTKMKIKDKFRHASGYYFIAPGSLESVDEFVDAEVEAQVEDAISTSVGGVLSAIGGVDQPTPAADASVQAPPLTLKARAQQFCTQLQALDTLESQLASSLPPLDVLDVIISSTQKSPQ